MRTLYLGCLLAAAVAVCVSPDAAAAEQPKAKPPNAKICKTIKQTGTHFRRRVCLKKHQWDQIEQDAQDQMRRITDRSATETGSD